MTKNKMPIIIAVAVLVVALGAFKTGIIGGKTDPNANKRYVVPPVELAAPFTVNTSDPDGLSYLQLSLAIQLEPMKQDAWDNFSGAGDKPGAVMPGAAAVAAYPKFRNAVIETAGNFSAAQLLTDAGKAKFKIALLNQFAQIYEVDEAEAKAAPLDPKQNGIAPPYKVKLVDLTNYAVQTGSAP